MKEAYCIASTRENCSVFLRSYWRNVFRAFFFFPPAALDPAYCIVWYGIEAVAGRDLEAAIEDVVSLLRGTTNDRGCAIACLRCGWLSRLSKSSSEVRGSQGALVASTYTI